MDLTTKISLTIELEGSTLIRENNDKEIIIVKNNNSKNKRSSKVKSGKQRIPIEDFQQITHINLVSKPAVYHIDISKYAYEWMVSDNCPSWIKKVSHWKSMTKKERLIEHLKMICQDMNGKNFTWKLLDD